MSLWEHKKKRGLDGEGSRGEFKKQLSMSVHTADISVVLINHRSLNLSYKTYGL